MIRSFADTTGGAAVTCVDWRPDWTTCSGSAWTACGCRLLPLPDGRRRLRHRRLHCGGLHVRVDGRFRTSSRPCTPGHADHRRPRANHTSDAHPWSRLPFGPGPALRGLLRLARRCHRLPGRPDHLRRHRDVEVDVRPDAAAVLLAPTSATSRTSTSTTRASSTPCSTWCGSGPGSGSTASGWTPSPTSSRRRAPAARTCRAPMSWCAGSGPWWTGSSPVVCCSRANQWPEDVVDYFGPEDEPECHMCFHFPVIRLSYAVRDQRRTAIVDILADTPAIPARAQWSTFLRNHDELTLEMVSTGGARRCTAGTPRMRGAHEHRHPVAGWLRCWTTPARPSSWRTPCCCPCRAVRACTTATRSAWATTSRCPTRRRAHPDAVDAGPQRRVLHLLAGHVRMTTWSVVPATARRSTVRLVAGRRAGGGSPSRPISHDVGGVTPARRRGEVRILLVAPAPVQVPDAPAAARRAACPCLPARRRRWCAGAACGETCPSSSACWRCTDPVCRSATGAARRPSCDWLAAAAGPGRRGRTPSRARALTGEQSNTLRGCRRGHVGGPAAGVPQGLPHAHAGRQPGRRRTPRAGGGGLAARA